MGIPRNLRAAALVTTGTAAKSNVGAGDLAQYLTVSAKFAASSAACGRPGSGRRSEGDWHHTVF
ncbi:hypothetical protein [Arthrobacter sp. NPDC057013]|uniref:hypothetical protein n=1 Tax=Arthrobacter sp. NPDC057013 TaxID=3345999 RepID=UPI00363E9D0D